MRAEPLILQMKYADIIQLFAERENISLDEALSFFYHSATYQLLKDGVSDMHCMSDGYLAEEISMEYENPMNN
ncbi:MAG: DUF3791 domain-containing protein [Clostridium sp.]|nr:DUF3791 domain-containing protein [Clostridium sp.]